MGRNPYTGDSRTRRAREQGYPARSVFKLKEIDQRFQLLRRGMSVLDLGCSPGSWSLYAARRVGPGGIVLGIDLQPCEPGARPPLVLVEEDASTLAAEQVEALTGDRCPPFDLVLSDMAPRTTGNRTVDHAGSMDLCDLALHTADAMAGVGSGFVAKAFEGADLPAFEARVRERYEKVKRVKPRGTRSRSVEVFVVGRGRRS